MRGVSYIHIQFQEYHNDIKPENVLLDRKPSSQSDVPRFMLADFGCSSRALDGGGGKRGGDPRYNAPEVWGSGTQASSACEVWSLGVMMYEMLSGGMIIFTDHPYISGWKAWSEYDGSSLFRKLRERIMVAGVLPMCTKPFRYPNTEDD